jgi:putative SOS response-associated peptidase YedK
MFLNMSVTPTPFDSDASDDNARLIIRKKPNEPGKPEMVKARWGSNPRFTDGVEFRFVRSEGKTFPSHRCLVPASEFQMRVGDKRYRARLDDGNFFYLAGIWEPPMGDWPLAFRIITVAANPEVSRYQERHGAIIFRRQVTQWLDQAAPEADLLETPPARTFVVEEIVEGPRQSALAL